MAILNSEASPLRGVGALAYWSRALLALTAGAIVLVSDEFLPTVVSLVLGASLIMFAFTQLGEVVTSLMNVHQKSRDRWILFFLTGPLLAVLYFYVDALWPRAGLVALAEIFICTQLAWQMRVARLGAVIPPARPVKAFEIMLWCFVAQTIVRTAVVFYVVPQGPDFRETLIATAIVFAIVFGVIATSILIWHELEVKDRAIRALSTVDADDNISNRHSFLEQLAASLGARQSTGMDYAALIRVVPDSVATFHFDPIEDATVYRAVGERISGHLDSKSLLAHYSEIEFGLLIRGRERGQALALLKSILDALRATPFASDHGEYRMVGTASAIPCGLSIGNPARALKVLKAGLGVTALGEVGFYALNPKLPDQTLGGPERSETDQRQLGNG